MVRASLLCLLTGALSSCAFDRGAAPERPDPVRPVEATSPNGAAVTDLGPFQEEEERDPLLPMFAPPAEPQPKPEKKEKQEPNVEPRPPRVMRDPPRLDPPRIRRPGDFQAKEGWFLGLRGAYTSHSDEDLDGQQFLQGADTIALPLIDDSGGGGVSFGYRYDRGAVALNYLQTLHDSTWLNTPLDVTYEQVSIEFYHFYNLHGRLQPFLNLGVATTELTVENGAFQGTQVADGILEDDLVLLLGGGFAFHLSERLKLDFGAQYRFAHEYTEAQGVAPKGSSSPVDDAGYNATITLSWTF